MVKYGAIICRKLAGKHDAGPAIGYQVMHDDEQIMAFRIMRKQVTTQKRLMDQVKRTPYQLTSLSWPVFRFYHL